MGLTSGTKLGPYEVVSPLGAGGMGEVYRARDTRLDRTVAIKILPAHLSDNPEAKQRFEREARTISSLNHPHICVLHDVGTHDGVAYLVMEFVQGESLESRLQKGSLPLKQVLEYSVQICDALEKAHRAGIVHRDLKPANIMLTASGAKLLDFGLAKPAAAVLGGARGLSEKGNLTPSTPTMNLTALSASPAALTQQGTIVGTFQYIAPEVLHGAEADARSDLFSLGCVLYEMVTGRKAFDGKSQLSVLTAILEKEPEPLAALQPATPAALDYAVQTCLEKNPDNRYQTAHDLKLQLAWVGKAGSQTGIPAVEAKGKNKWWIAALALLAVAGIVFATTLWSGRQPRRVVRSNILPPEGARFETMYHNGPLAISPDGTRVAFVARQNEKNSLWLRSLDKLDATQLTGTDDAYFPFWSPDGSMLAFFMHGKLWRMELNGGSPIEICDAPEARGGSWSRDNVIVFSATPTGPVSQVSSQGGTRKAVTKTPMKAGFESDRWPFFLPDGKHFLYLHSPNGDADDRNEIRFAGLDGNEQMVLRGHYYTFQYAAGWLFADRGGALQAWKFDPANGKVSGEAVQVVDKIASDEITSGSSFSVSPQGILIYQLGSGSNGDRHLWLDETGKQLSQLSEPNIYGATRISPDGTKIATPMVAKTGDQSLWMWDLAGGTRAQVSAGGTYDTDMPIWSADGRTLYFTDANAGGHLELLEAPADGSRQQRVLIKTDTDVSPTDCTSDGKWLLYEEAKTGPGQNAVLKAYPLVSGLETFTVLDSVSASSNARLKPGSNDWLAYQANESGSSEVYLTRFPHATAKYQVSRSGASQPVWSRDGKKLFYLDASLKMTSVDIQTANDSVQIGIPKTLFQTGVRNSVPTEAYDVARDGRFLMVDSVVESTAPVVLVTNWDAELKK